MKKLFLFLMLTAATAGATTISASHVVDFFGNGIPSARLCFAPVNAAAQPQGFRLGSNQVVPGEVCGKVTAGALVGGLSVQANPTGIFTHIYAKAANANTILMDYGMTAITGGSWTLDTYDISSAVPAITTTTVTPMILNPSTSTGAPALGIGNNAERSNDAQITVARNVDDSNTRSGIDGHAFSDSSVITRTGGMSYNSFDNRVIVNDNSGQNMGHLIGFQAAPTWGGTGTLGTGTNPYGEVGFFHRFSMSAGIVAHSDTVHVEDAIVTGGELQDQRAVYCGALASATKNWCIYSLAPNYFNAITHGNRFSCDNASALVAGDFVLSGWGSTASISVVNGTDCAATVFISSAGTGQVSGPTLTFTYHDGSWKDKNGAAKVPIPVWVRDDVLSPNPAPFTATFNDTQVVYLFNGTPVAGNTYVLNFITMGR